MARIGRRIGEYEIIPQPMPVEPVKPFVPGPVMPAPTSEPAPEPAYPPLPERVPEPTPEPVPADPVPEPVEEPVPV